jgi:hypothetical protein
MTSVWVAGVGLEGTRCLQAGIVVTCVQVCTCTDGVPMQFTKGCCGLCVGATGGLHAWLHSLSLSWLRPL